MYMTPSNTSGVLSQPRPVAGSWDWNNHCSRRLATFCGVICVSLLWRYPAYSPPNISQRVGSLEPARRS
jgi:hypothetical protein